MWRFLTITVGPLLLAGSALAGAIDVGPAVGTRAPAIHAKDASGAPRDLRSVMGPNGVVLVFYRSAKWCPYCQAQLMSLREAPAPLAQRGYRLAAISYDSPELLSGFAIKRDIPFVLLSDEGSKTIDAFGLRDPQYKLGTFAYGVPQPAIFVIAPSGRIRAKLAEEGYKTRPPLSAILSMIDQLK